VTKGNGLCCEQFYVSIAEAQSATIPADPEKMDIPIMKINQ
jgi:hypothetical protein